MQRLVFRKTGALGSTDAEAAQIEQLLDMINNALNAGIGRSMFEKDEQTKKRIQDEYFATHFDGFAKQFSKLLRDNSSGSGFLVGKTVRLYLSCCY